jgi:hypothetical protein
MTAQSAGHMSSSLLAIAGAVAYRLVDFPMAALRALCDFGRNVSDQAVLIRGLRRVNDGISPKTVR